MAVIYIQRCLFSNISVTEAHILKCDILVIALFAMFLATVNSKLSPFIIFVIFNPFQVYLAAS